MFGFSNTTTRMFEKPDPKQASRSAIINGIKGLGSSRLWHTHCDVL
ncbi:MAG TPA: hypothetical protein VG966_03660 [Hyphomicrobiaceae bacterium]|nr:hypothetical protein [Hyphomicrobiaceae bacterium]